jgi:hypothetical protein
LQAPSTQVRNDVLSRFNGIRLRRSLADIVATKCERESAICIDAVPATVLDLVAARQPEAGPQISFYQAQLAQW